MLSILVAVGPRRAHNRRIKLNVDDVPLRLGDLHTASDQRVTLSAWPGNGSIKINIFPGDLDLILFDFATQEITGQGAADALAKFVRATGQATTRSVAVSLEGDFTKVVATYDPRKDIISLA